MKDEILMPCTEWAEKLAARHPEDISPSDRVALNNHIASCRTCAAVHAAYRVMEINVRALPTTSLPGLSYERLWQRERPIMPSVSSLLVYFGFFSRGEFLTAPTSGHPIRRSTSIKQSLFYHAIVACLALILIVGAVGLSVSSRPHISKSSTITSTPTVSATPPVSSDSPSSRTLPVNLLLLSLYRRCPDYSYSLAHQEVDPQQQGQSCNPACKALQTEG